MNRYSQYMYSYPHKTAYRPLLGISIEKYFKELYQGKSDLYIHLPFCQAKCGYCNLFSVTWQGDKTIDAYLKQLDRQFIQYSQYIDFADIRWKSIVLGGGTPTLLSQRQMERLFCIVERHLKVSLEEIPVIMEGSPGKCTRELLTYLKHRGVQRISIGIQSFSAEELRSIGRVFTPEQCEAALNEVKELGFADRNIDLIYGLPGQTLDSFHFSLEKALSFDTHEVFLYPLYVKPGTSLFSQYAPDADLQLAMYRTGREKLLEYGYTQTSMRRFHKQPEDNVTSCGFEAMLAMGCGGRSYLGDLHFCTPFGVGREKCMEILEKYLDRDNFLEGFHGFILEEDDRKRRFIIKNLFFFQGLDKKEYNVLFGTDPEKEYPILERFIEEGYAAAEQGNIRLSQAGMEYSDCLGPMLISDKVEKLMKEFRL